MRSTLRSAIWLVAFPIAVLAQVDTGAISGTVSDQSGAIIGGAQVIVTQQETNVRVTLKTNPSGFYSAPALRPGRYDVQVNQQGFQGQKKTGVDLRVQDRLELNFTLSVGAASSEVSVEAAAPLLESETSSLGQVIQERTINELPLNGRNFIQLATLTAGALPSTRTNERDNFISNARAPRRTVTCSTASTTRTASSASTATRRKSSNR